jgi:hypothetical protein
LKYFNLIHQGLDVAPILAELDAHPMLWDAHKERTADERGFMHGTSDIWLRYFARETLKSPADYLGEGRCVFYPAWRALPSIHPIAFSLMAMCQGVELGVGLISRIPPGGEVKTHNDAPAWSARYYDRKFYCILRANRFCLNTTLDEQVVMQPGSIWEFNNLVPHSVQNEGDSERINLILTLRSAAA